MPIRCCGVCWVGSNGPENHLPNPPLPFHPTPTPAEYRKYVEAFAADEELFFKKFASAYGKLMELGVPAFSGKGAGTFDSIKGALGLKK